MRYFDTHAHVNLAPLDAHADELLEQCASKGIFVNVIGVDGPSSERAYELALRHPNAVCSAAIHPNNLAELGEQVEKHLRMIEKLLENDHSRTIVCVGETGLDASRGGDLAVQTDYFLRHARLAERFDLPLNVHCRDAHAEMARLLKGVAVAAIIHCFTAGPEEAAAYVKLGCFLSIPGVVTFKNARALQEAVRQTPWEHLVVETDAPYLSPEPVRGRTNTPLHVVHVVEKIAALKNVEVAQAADILFANALRALRTKAPSWDGNL